MTYTAWDGVSAVEKMSPRDAPAVIGAHWTTRLSRVADRIEPYEAKRRKVVPRPIIDRHLPTVKRVGGKLVKTGRTKAAETVRSISYDVSSINDKDKLIREVATGQGKIRPAVAKSYVPRNLRSLVPETGWVKATELTPKTRKLLTGELHSRQYARQRGQKLNSVGELPETASYNARRDAKFARRAKEDKRAYMQSRGWKTSPVKKSFIPGKGWVPASKIPKHQLRALASESAAEPGWSVRQVKAFRQEQEAKDRFRRFAQYQQNIRAEVDELLNGKADISDVLGRAQAKRLTMGRWQAADKLGSGTEAAAVQFGGRRGERFMMTRGNASKETLAHELAHLSPKRSSYRMWDIYTDRPGEPRGSGGIRGMREEARAEMASGHPQNFFGTATTGRLKGYDSGYIAAAVDEGRRAGMYLGAPGPRQRAMYTPEAVSAFRNVQNRIYTANGGKFRGNQYVDELRQRRRGTGQNVRHFVAENPVPSAALAASATLPVAIGANHARKKLKARKVEKSFQPWDGLHSEVSKMGPDQSELHVAGSSNQRRKARLRKLPPDAIRRVC